MLEVLRETVGHINRRLNRLEASERAESADAHPKSTFANLPAAGKSGRVRYCTDCRKVGEGSGAGTGTIVYDDATAWRRTGDDTTAAV